MLTIIIGLFMIVLLSWFALCHPIENFVFKKKFNFLIKRWKFEIKWHLVILSSKLNPWERWWTLWTLELTFVWFWGRRLWLGRKLLWTISPCLGLNILNTFRGLKSSGLRRVMLIVVSSMLVWRVRVGGMLYWPLRWAIVD